MMKELDAGAYVTSSVRLLAPLARGGMGTVWVAEHLVLETHVVVKLMTRQVAGHAEAAARFAREAAIAAAVKCPHVVQVFDSGVSEDGVAYIVMELLEGRDLAADLAAHGRMAPEEVAIVLTQLARALAAAHRAGIVHRDLKPENVFLCDGEPGELFVKLLDFGTAKDDARAPFATVTGQLLGTPYYMSPEQLLGAPVDAHADIWSLGVLAFEALTGTRPFDGATVGAITLAVHSAAPRMTDFAPDLPPALDDWFSRACARDPDDRFPTARAASEAFAVAMRARAIGASVDEVAQVVPLTRRVSHPGRPAARADRAVSLSSTLAPPRREHRLTSWAVVGVFVASVLGMLALFTSDPPQAAPRPLPSSPRTAVAPLAAPSLSAAEPSAPSSTAVAPASSTPPAPSAVATTKAAGGSAPTPARVRSPRAVPPPAAPPPLEPEPEPQPVPDPEPETRPGLFREPQ
jgi:eukaryotic-like serine/threonine-protein kinase